MPYPTIAAPYGLKPINLLGGQVFAGSTRNWPIPYGYATNVFYGDLVQLSRGFVVRAAVSTGTGLNQTHGVFLGCTFTNPITKQKQFSQFWPANTLSGDAQAVVCDDPDTVFRAAVVTAQGGVIIGSSSLAVVGQNVSLSDLAGNVNTGNSSVAVLASAATPVTTTLPARIIDVVRDTAVFTSALGSSTTTTITLTGAGLPIAIPVGTDVSYLATNGQVIQTGSFVTVATVAGATSITINQQPIVLGTGTNIPAASTIIFTQYPEVLIKLQFGLHAYYSATGVA